jgi:hypothetical protein
MERHVIWYVTDVSEDPGAFIFKVILKMEAAGYSETFVMRWHTTWRNMPDDSNLQYKHSLKIHIRTPCGKVETHWARRLLNPV